MEPDKNCGPCIRFTHTMLSQQLGFNTTSNVSGRGMGGAVFGPVRPGPLTLTRKSSSTCEVLQTLFGFIVSLSYIGNFRFSPVETNARK